MPIYGIETFHPGLSKRLRPLYGYGCCTRNEAYSFVSVQLYLWQKGVKS